MLQAVETIPEEIFLKFCNYLNERNMESLLSLFKEDATVIGTGRDEYRIGINEIKAQFERDWSQSEKGHFEMTKHVHSSKDGLSWGSCEFVAKITIDGKEHIFPYLRASIFLEKDGSDIKISHLHSSFADPIQDEGKSFRE